MSKGLFQLRGNCTAIKWFALFGICVFSGSVLRGQSNIEVEGMGFFANRSLDARLAFLHGYEAKEAVELDSVVLEDSAFLLLEQVKREGYLRPSLEGIFETEGGEVRVRWGADYEVQLPIDFEANKALFRIEPGVLYFYEEVEVEGLEEIEDAEAERFFIPGGFLLGGKSARVFTRENLERRTQRLLRSVEVLGYRSVAVVEQEIEMNHETGAVRIWIDLDTGPLHQVGEVEVEIFEPGGAVRREDYAVEEGVAYTREWERGVREDLVNQAFAAGYPDARVSLEVTDETSPGAGLRLHDLRFTVERGQRVELEKVRFEGDPDTRRSLLRRQVGLQAGEPLNRLEVMEGRRKLMGLGIYSAVDLELVPESGDAREAVFRLTPSERKELRLRAGWGSYELARAGLEWEHRNPFGRAHRYTFGLKQSFKSSRAEAGYTIPQVFGSNVSAYSNAEYSYREEISYDQSKFGSSVGLAKQLESGIRLAAEYGIFREEVERSGNSDFDAETDATVASVELSASIDRRDDFLSPTSGYSLFASYELAGKYLGGDVDFNKLRAGGTLHFSLTESLIVHSGLQWGTIFSSGEASDNIPFGERFFNGGEDSVRGYRQGEASPLDQVGEAIGAESYLLGNFELEQRVMERFSVVLFLDAVCNARDGFFEDAGDTLSSVGLGLRYHTPVGPLRLEYGHNLNPREEDPAGTLHFSIGFPF